jgi:branched-chain amino acid transport system ATP-binding protein
VNAPQLRVTALSKAFGGVLAVDNVSFEFAPGKVNSIIGPNGAGKTTLLNLLTGIYVPSAGSVAFDGADVTGLPPHLLAARGMARTFQNLQIFFNMSALENVMVGRHLHERSGLLAAMLRSRRLARGEFESRDEAAKLMRFVGLGDFIDAEADALPYGALKRLEIARALGAKPKLLLLDEPAAGLNPTETQAIDALIARLVQFGVTVVLVEHNMRLVMGVSDHILVLDYGRKLAEGTAMSIRNDPKVIEAYLGSAVAHDGSYGEDIAGAVAVAVEMRR